MRRSCSGFMYECRKQTPTQAMPWSRNQRAGAVEPLVDLLHQVQWHDAVGLDPEVRVAVAVGHALAADLEDAAEPLRGDESEPAEVVLQQGVGGDRGAVHDLGGRVGADL